MHLTHEDDGMNPACTPSIPMDDGFLTVAVEEVTCRSCKRTRLYKQMHRHHEAECLAPRLYAVFSGTICGQHLHSRPGDMPPLDRLDPVVREAWLAVAKEALQ